MGSDSIAPSISQNYDRITLDAVQDLSLFGSGLHHKNWGLSLMTLKFTIIFQKVQTGRILRVQHMVLNGVGKMEKE